MRLLVVAAVLLSGLLYGIELQCGNSYEGPVKLTARSLGVGLGISSGWTALLPETGGLQVSSKEKNILITMRSKELSSKEAMQYLNFPIEYTPGVMMFPSKRIVTLTPTKFRRSFRVSGRSAAAVIYIILGPQHRAVVMTGFGTPNEQGSMKTEMLSIANTITFTQIKPLMDDESPLKKKLSGGYFVYYENVGLRSEKRMLWLCPDGRFILRAHQAVANASSGMLIEYLGTWLVDKNVLILQYSDGSQKPIALREEGNAIFFNEIRSYQLTNRVCK